MKNEYEELLNRIIHQFLVHSFLYYKLDTSIISDEFYDKICFDLVELKKNDEYKKHRYSSYIEGLDASGSGFYLSKYPPNIISTAFHLLYNNLKPNETFPQFVARWGYGQKT